MPYENASLETLVSDLTTHYLSICDTRMAPDELAEQPAKVDALRDIGQQLNDLGGYKMMRDAVAQVFRDTGEVHATAAHFNQIWDGIGSWRR